MESRLKLLFNFQHFVENQELSKMIGETEARYFHTSKRLISDEDAELLAAGAAMKDETCISSNTILGNTKVDETVKAASILSTAKDVFS